MNDVIGSLLGLNLPFYISVTLLLAYIIWSKFLNKGKLKPKNINDILDIFAISICLIVFLIVVIPTFVAIVSGHNLYLNISTLLNAVPDLVAIFSLYGIWFLIISSRKKVSKSDLKAEFTRFIRVLLYLGAFWLGLFLPVFFTDLKYALLGEVLTAYVFILMAICIGYITANKIVEIGRRDICNGWVSKIIITCILLIGIIVGYFSIPQITPNEPIHEKYYISNPNPDFREAYLQIEVPIDIKSFGEFDLIPSSIPIHYGHYGLETTGEGGKNFKLLINSTKGNRISEFIDGFEELKPFRSKNGNKFGFTDAILDEGKGLLNLKFDKKFIKDEGITQIILEGFIRKNISELNYSYYDNSIYRETCNQDSCTFIFNITNNLDLPVYQKEKNIINFNNRNIKNKSNCKFVNATLNSQLNSTFRMIDNSCKENSCVFQIKNIESGKDIFYMYLDIDRDDNVVRLYKLNIAERVQVNAEVKLSCI